MPRLNIVSVSPARLRLEAVLGAHVEAGHPHLGSANQCIPGPNCLSMLSDRVLTNLLQGLTSELYNDNDTVIVDHDIVIPCHVAWQFV